MTPQERLKKCEDWVRNNVQYFNPHCTCLDCQITRHMSGEAHELRVALGVQSEMPLPRSEEAVRSAETLKELQIHELEHSADISDRALGWSMRHSYDLNTPNPYGNDQYSYIDQMNRGY